MKQGAQGLLVAAGSSRRFGSDKRFAALDGIPMVLRALRNLQTAVDSVVMVIRPGERPRFLDLVAADNAPTLVEAEHAAAGMGASLACGIRHIRGGAVVVALADMPFVQPASIRCVADALANYPLVVPSYRGRRGHPVGFQRRFFAELAELDSDRGGKQLLQSHPEMVHEIALNDPGILTDIDTPAGLAASD